jgi:hypothetical protein
MAVIGATSERHPMGDVIFAYKPWVDAIFAGGKWFGINTPWVYPFPALAPVLLAKVISPGNYLAGWLTIAIGLNEIALAILLLRHREATRLAWYWLAATLALGPVALSRIDGISISLALIGLGSLLAAKLRGAGYWFTVSAWLKVWPLALLAALFVPVRNRLTVLRSVIYGSSLIAVVGFLLGANQSLFSFISTQENRGIQIESVAAMPWVWSAASHSGSKIYYDDQVLAYQVRGAGTYQLAGAIGWYMVATVCLILALALWAQIRGCSEPELLAITAFCITLALIVFNKVGSPQYLGWLILPVLLGMHYRVRGWWAAIAGVLVATSLTQVIYPNIYDSILLAEYWPLMVLTLRNGIEIVLFIWGISKLVRLAFKKQPKQL